MARNEAHHDSDVDLLVEFNQHVGLFAFIGLKQYLEAQLGCKVDLGTPRSLKPGVKANVLRRPSRSPRNWLERIEDILTCARNIQEFTAEISLEDFLDDPRTSHAVA